MVEFDGDIYQRYAKMVMARGPEVAEKELIRLQTKIANAQKALLRGDPMAAAKALHN